MMQTEALPKADTHPIRHQILMLLQMATTMVMIQEDPVGTRILTAMRSPA